MASGTALIRRKDVDTSAVDFSDVVEPGLDSGGPIHPGETLLGFLEDSG